jgi:ABC-type phosphate transport system auxiliary subunit
MLALADVKESMKKELKELEAKLKALREAMERYDVFQQDDEIGLALAEVEAELANSDSDKKV